MLCGIVVNMLAERLAGFWPRGPWFISSDATILLGSNLGWASCLLALPPQPCQLQETGVQ